MYRKLLGINIAVFEANGQLLIIYSASYKQYIPVVFEYIINKTT